MAYVKLSKMPDAKKEYTLSFPALTGGLNVQELDYRLDNHESPKMQNLRWRDGVLSSRDGQVWKNNTFNGEGHAAYQWLWCDALFAHVGNTISCFDREGTKTVLYTGPSDFTTRGTFFDYDGKLYYKTKGYYIVISSSYSNGEWTYSARDVVDISHKAYSPVTYINCSPENGSGDVYQPENRLSAEKTLWYNAEHKVSIEASNATLVPEIVQVTWLVKFPNSGSYAITYNGTAWCIGGEEILLSDYGISVSGVPVTDDALTITSVATDLYYLPIKDPNLTLGEVTVDGVAQTKEEYVITNSDELGEVSINKVVWSGQFQTSVVKRFEYWGAPSSTWTLDNVPVTLSDYGLSYSGTEENLSYIKVDYTYGTFSYDGPSGQLKFRTAPPVTVPATNNTVRVTYSIPNPTAFNNIMDCRYVATYGGSSSSLCIVMAGSETQPNAYFWNGQTSIAMDPTYFPMSQYQIAGSFTDPITGFGKQQSYLIIFSEGSVGRTVLSTSEIDGRTTIDLPYTPINSKAGCNLPWTIQLVENNLVWCNTEQGVHFLADTSAAYENNVICISAKVNGSNARAALLYDVRKEERDAVCSLDTEHRYWLVANDHVWMWDYELSNYKKPTWFFHTNIRARALVIEPESRSLGIENIWHIDGQGRMTHFENTFSDYGEPIEKIYRFATQFFGTYDSLKNVSSVLITMRSDTTSHTELKYITDYEDRFDLTPLETTTWRLVPRNLRNWDPKSARFAAKFRRRPMCRRVVHFTMELTNNISGQDMSVVTAQILYNFQGRQR